MGDLVGIIQKLNYLVELSVVAIGLSPLYPSPMANYGYDVADCTATHPICRSIEDMLHWLE